MRRLKRLCEKADISVLAVSDAAEPRENWATESDLGRSVILCRVADSVFSIGRMPGQDMRSRLIQSRARTPKIFWRPANAPIGSIKQLTSGLIGFEFDGRFAPLVDEARQERICDVYWRHEGGSSFRVIADELGISKTTVQRLCRMWTPAMGGKPVVAVEQPEPEEEEEEEIVDGGLAEIWLSEERGRADTDVEDVEEKEEPKPSIFDLERGYDSNWNEIFIEEREGYTGRPKIWYQRDRDGAVKRSERRLYGIHVEHLRAGEFF
jgi:hypothetical protein